ncbi:hypothetical protein DU475_15850 [Rhodopseudomonas sp. WA056]|nr:hypothetical protein [Rhodopseudomonas sp. WA056]
MPPPDNPDFFNPSPNRSEPSMINAMQIAIGVALGVGVGIALDNVVAGIGIGLALAIAIGWIRRDRRDES